MTSTDPPRSQWPLWTALVGIPTLLCMPACERISYYSISGASDATGDAGAGASGHGPSTSPSTTTGPAAVSRAMVLDAVGTCATALYADIETATATLEDATAELSGDPSPEAEATARTAWLNAISLWQQAELLKIGVAGPTSLPEGEGLRDYIYSWPLVSRCLVEQTLVQQKYDDENFAVVGLVNTRGLAAQEYLLFYEGADNGCSASASINAQGTWDALGSATRTQRKRDYAHVLSEDLSTKTTTLHAAWSSGGFADGLARAGTGGSPFESERAALNAVSDGLFYLEVETKDGKLAKPLGLSDTCTEASCPDDVESQYARVAVTHIHSNLLGFRRIYEGCAESEDIGFDDLLRTLGAGELADRMSNDLASAVATVEGLQDKDLITLMVSDKAAAEGIHTAVKRLTDALKTEFITVLDLDLPAAVEGDND